MRRNHDGTLDQNGRGQRKGMNQWAHLKDGEDKHYMTTAFEWLSVFTTWGYIQAFVLVPQHFMCQEDGADETHPGHDSNIVRGALMKYEWTTFSTN